MRRMRWVSLAILTLGLTAAWPAHAQKPPILPAVNVAITAEIADADGWLAMHQEILSTPPGSAKALIVSIPAREGAPRSFVLSEPKFWMTMGAIRGASRDFKLVNLYVRGKVAGSEALPVLPGFVSVITQAGGSSVPGLRLEYGLATVTGDLIELKVEDR